MRFSFEVLPGEVGVDDGAVEVADDLVDGLDEESNCFVH